MLSLRSLSGRKLINSDILRCMSSILFINNMGDISNVTEYLEKTKGPHEGSELKYQRVRSTASNLSPKENS